jgi:archaellum component FlaC
MTVTAGKKDSARIMDMLENIENEIGSVLDTLEVVADRDTLDSIERGIGDIKEKRVISFDDFLKKHGRK